MRQMQDDFKTTFIFSTHDPKIVKEAEIIYTLEDGKLIDKEVIASQNYKNNSNNQQEINY